MASPIDLNEMYALEQEWHDECVENVTEALASVHETEGRQRWESIRWLRWFQSEVKECRAEMTTIGNIQRRARDEEEYMARLEVEEKKTTKEQEEEHRSQRLEDIEGREDDEEMADHGHELERTNCEDVGSRAA